MLHCKLPLFGLPGLVDKPFEFLSVFIYDAKNAERSRNSMDERPVQRDTEVTRKPASPACCEAGSCPVIDLRLLYQVGRCIMAMLVLRRQYITSAWGFQV